ncbi:uncharacterized protein ACIB01_012544 isoform 1-T1 [Guaruba guarouba]
MSGSGGVQMAPVMWGSAQVSNHWVYLLQRALPCPRSRAGLLLQEKNGLLEACFCSIFHLPPQDSQGPEAWLYCKTLSVMDSTLQVLVCSARTLSIQELQNIFTVWPWHRVPLGSDPRLEWCPPPSPASWLLPEPLLLPQHTLVLTHCLCCTTLRTQLPVWKGEPSPGALPPAASGAISQSPTTGPQGGVTPKPRGPQGQGVEGETFSEGR